MAVEAKLGCARYLAGLIDGDGAIMIRRREKPETRTDRRRGLSFIILVGIGGEPGHLKALRDEFGQIGTIWVRRREGQHHIAEWKIAGGQAVALLRAVSPHLRLKKDQALLVLGMPLPRSRWGVTPELREQQERCFLEIKRLNHRFGRGKEADHGRGVS